MASVRWALAFSMGSEDSDRKFFAGFFKAAIPFAFVAIVPSQGLPIGVGTALHGLVKIILHFPQIDREWQQRDRFGGSIQRSSRASCRFFGESFGDSFEGLSIGEFQRRAVERDRLGGAAASNCFTRSVSISSCSSWRRRSLLMTNSAGPRSALGCGKFKLWRKRMSGAR